jgi:glycosyltransferase involved in cell wall biosynthesis
MNSNLKVLFVFPYDWLTSPRSTKEVAFLKESGYDPIIVWTNHKYITSGKDVPSSPQFEGAFKKLPSFSVPFFVTSLDLAGRGLFVKICTLAFYLMSITIYSLYLFVIMLQICVTKQIRLIHVHNTPDLEGFISLLVSKITGTPYIFEVHDHTPELYAESMNLKNNSILFNLLKMMEREVVSNSAGNIFTSQTSKRAMEIAYYLDPSKSIVIYSGPYKNLMLSNQYNTSELKILTTNEIQNKFKILYLGSLATGFRRGLDLLIESMVYLVHTYKLTNITLIFVGDGGGMIERLSELASDLKVLDYVSFQGKLPRKEAYKWLKIADIVVDPLRGSPSTITLVTNKDLEYMAAKKIIIASDVMGHKEILKNYYNGLLFSDGNACSLADSIRYVIDNFEDANVQIMGINAENGFLEKYCWEKQEPKLLALYKKIVNCAIA